MSFNAWLYGYANPQRYTDPTGYVAYDESKEADFLIDELSATYGIRVLKDWGMNMIPVPVPGEQKSDCYWKNGRWSLWDLKILDYSVKQLADHMNGSNRFRYSVGPVTVVKTPSTCGRGCTYNYFFFRRIELLDTGKPAKEAPIENFIMTQVVDFDAWSVVHELGHAWDDNFSNWLSAQLETQTGGYTDSQHKNPKGCESFQPGCNNAGYFYGGTPPKGADAGFNRLEDFAESVAAYVFPTYAQNAVSKYSADPKYKNLFYTEYTQTERWQYINNLVNGK